MRTLAAPPASVLSPSTGLPEEGAFRGPLPRVDLGPGDGRLFKLAHHKKWTYLALTTDTLLIGLAIVDLGYAANAFAFAFEKGRGMLVDRTAMGPAFAVRVSDHAEEGALARFAFGGTRFALTRPFGASDYDLDLRAPDLEVRARLSTVGAPPPIAAIAKLPGRCVNATQKRALLAVEGTAILAGRSFRLDGGLGGIDYTHGFLARHTAWKWAFLLGRARAGEKVALNLVEGFVGEAECALWIDDELVPVGEGRFEHDLARPMDLWRVHTTCGAVDLAFEPGGLHHEEKNLGLVRSRFLQVAGAYRGTINLPGRPPLVIDGALGVTEDQDVLW
jgi:hypothetical protein